MIRVRESSLIDRARRRDRITHLFHALSKTFILGTRNRRDLHR